MLLLLDISSTCSILQLPVITDLRNPALKQRHWDAIESVLEFHFTEEEPLTLGQLERIHAFRHSEALQEISGQASSEAGLEAILRKVTQFTEFTITENIYLLCVVVSVYNPK